MAECITPCVTITNESLTNGVDSIGGSGTFDVLMAASREHLKREHSAGRITGSQFAEVYIASMQAAMSASVQFALQKDRVGYDIQAILENIQLTEEQKALIIAQTAQVKAETLNVPKQGVILDKEAINLDTQKLSIEAQTDLTELQHEVLTENRNWQPLR